MGFTEAEWTAYNAKQGTPQEDRRETDVERFLNEYYAVADKLVDPKTQLLDPAKLEAERALIAKKYDVEPEWRHKGKQLTTGYTKRW